MKQKSAKRRLAFPLPRDAKWEAVGRGMAEVIAEKQARIDRLEALILMTFQNVCHGVDARVLDEADDNYQFFCEDIIERFKQLKGKE